MIEQTVVNETPAYFGDHLQMKLEDGWTVAGRIVKYAKGPNYADQYMLAVVERSKQQTLRDIRGNL